MKKVLFSALVVAAAVGCAKQNDDVVSNNGLNEIRLGSAITGQTTKAAYDGNVAINNLWFLRKDGAVTANDFTGITAVVGNRAVGGVITFQNTQRYAASGNTYFASYYPAGSVDNNVVTWPIDGKTDIMTAAVIDAGSNDNHATPGVLAYRHELTQVEVICKAVADGGAVQSRWGKILSIKMHNTPVSMSYAYNGLVVAPSTTLGDVALAKPDYTSDFEAIAIPSVSNTAPNAAGMFAPVASQNFTLEIVTETGGTKVTTVVLGLGEQLLRGKKNKVTLTFNPASSEDDILVSSTVEAWTPGATGAGNLI